MADGGGESSPAGVAPRLLVVQGPTASGKSEVAMRLAEVLGGEIVYADSMQVFRGLDVGTAKPTPEDRASSPPRRRPADIGRRRRASAAPSVTRGADPTPGPPLGLPACANL